MSILNKVGRVTTAGKIFIPQIDGLRFVAILAVIAFHLLSPSLHRFGIASTPESKPPNDIVATLFSTGHVGVNVFFAISGFVVLLPFAKGFMGDGPNVGVGKFYWRRLSRMQPPYVIHLVFLFILSCAVLRHLPQHPHLYHNEAWLSYLLQHLAPSLFFANGFIYAEHPYPNMVLWALEAEIQFYILAPVLAGIFLISNKTRRRALIAALIVVCSLVPLLFSQKTLWRFLILGQLQAFLPGILLADLYLTGAITRSEKKGSIVWDLLFLLGSASLVLVALHPGIAFVNPWLVLLICVGVFEGKLLPKLLSIPWIAAIGGMSYTIYMYHLIMISSLIRVTGTLRTGILSLDLLTQWVVMSTIIIAACTVLYLLFEKPFMHPNWPAELWSRITRQPVQDEPRMESAPVAAANKDS